MKTSIPCWNCDTEYDYNQHEICPICDSHWLDAPKQDREQGERVSVHIDYTRLRLRALRAIAVLLVFVSLSSCTTFKVIVVGVSLAGAYQYANATRELKRYRIHITDSLQQANALPKYDSLYRNKLISMGFIDTIPPTHHGLFHGRKTSTAEAGL